MWTFNDKGGRPTCLIPEVTGIVQEIYRNEWEKSRKKPIRIFYVNRCYRYEKPQAGRYREFTQFGIELLGGKSPDDKREVVEILLSALESVSLKDYLYFDSVKRGLNYYTEEGFEIVCEKLGAQKQVAGGGRYREGIGWAIGVDRLVLALGA